jgi:hypothetical protein
MNSMHKVNELRVPMSTSKHAKNNRLRLPTPINDPREYEEQMAVLPSDEKTVVEALTRFANLCQFLSDRRLELPDHITSGLRSAAELSATERVAIIERLNQELLEYIHRVSADSGIRM